MRPQGRGRGRRHVVQLDGSSSSGYLARYGYQSLTEDVSSGDRGSEGGSRLINLVGAYADSGDSDGEDMHEDEEEENGQNVVLPRIPEKSVMSDAGHIPTVPSSILLPVPSEPGSGKLDFEVANFLAEIDAISTTRQERETVTKADKEPEPAFSQGSDDFKSVFVSGHPDMPEEKNYMSMFTKGETEFVKEREKSYSSVFVKGESEVSKHKGKDTKYKSLFVKGQPEFVGKEERTVLEEKTSYFDAVNNDDEDDYNIPEAPTSSWQQCLDENTQYSYYWNTATNEVTWEIPSEYTQYLLLYKEYEEKMAKIPEEKKLQARKKTAGETEKPIKRNGKAKGEDSLSAKGDSPLHSVAAEWFSGTSSPPVQHPNLPDDILEVKKISDKSLEKTKLAGSKKSKNSYSSSSGEKLDHKHNSDTSKSRSHTSKSEKHSSGSRTEKSSSKCESSQLIEDQVDPKIDICQSKKSKHKGKSDKRDSKNGAEEQKMKHIEDIDGVAMEEEKKPSVVEDEDEDLDFDLDDIDRALEMALERKKVELKRLEEEDARKKPTKPVEATRPKRQAPVDSDDEELDKAVLTPKKTKLVAYAPNDEDESDEENMEEESIKEVARDTDPTPEKCSIPKIIKIKDRVEDLASIALGKLEFLEITKKGMSKLQVLLLELQTRFRDWQDGGLDTEYFVHRLEEANSQLEQYEQSAVPSGWSCHWDRNFRRYFYTNKTTGDSQWDYPDAELQQPLSPSEGSMKSKFEETIQSVTSSSINGSTDEKKVFIGPKLEKEEAAMHDGSSEPDSSGEIDSLKLKSATAASEITASKVETEDSHKREKDSSASEPKSSLEDIPIFPGEPPPPGTEVLFGVPPPPPPSEPYPGNEVSYSVDQDSPDDGDMDIDESDSGKTTENLIETGIPADTMQAPAVIYKPPQINVTSSSSSSTSIVASPALITGQPSLPDSTECVNFMSPGGSPAPEDLIPSSSTQELPIVEGEKRERKEKKKKKDKKMSSNSLSLKKKNVSSLVQKWQQVKVQVEKEEKFNEERQQAIRQKLEEWKREQAHS